MRVIIVCGSRDFHNRVFLEAKLKKITNKLTSFELVTGACPTGADKMAEDWALKQFPMKKIKLTRFHAEWGVHGRGAGPMRNKEMSDYAGSKGVCIAFRNKSGPSPGTDNMISLATKAGMKVLVYKM